MIADVAITPDDGTFHHMGECPYPCSGADLLALAKSVSMDKDVAGHRHRI
jgi:hypothetical protein